MERIKKITLFFIFLLMFLFPAEITAAAQSKTNVDFFYSTTCPHCIREQSFLNDLEKNLKSIKVNRYVASQNTSLLNNYYKKYRVPTTYHGAVPITFIKDKYFLGFNDQIGNDIRRYLSGNSDVNNLADKINPKNFSLPVLAVVLGSMDGFNVCSLGALMIILTLVLSLRSRKKILAFGFTYLLTTAITYGGLIFFWYQIFRLINPFIRKMEILIGIITLLAGVYFLREFIDAYLHGPNCKITEGKKITGKFMTNFKKMVAGTEKLLPILISIFIFAATITVVEFPCSAAVPLVFAGILSKSHLTPLIYFIYMSIYLIFYLLDEIVIFLVALFSMKLWLSSPKFITWIILAQTVIMFLLSAHYLFGIV